MATEYVVLRHEPDEDLWRFVGETTAAGSAAAVRKVTDAKSPASGVYAAVPSRSFRPVTVSHEQVSRTLVKPMQDWANAKVAA